jgi:hypothetical protein
MNFIKNCKIACLALCLGLGLLACGPSEKEIKLEKMLDLVAWKADRGGCNNRRSLMIDSLKAAKETIRGIDINAITAMMGKPDMQLLTSRNQKYYIYCLEPGTHCQDIRQGTKARTIALRFSALGIVTEITFQRGRP